MNQETKQLTAAQHLEEVRIYDRRLSEFLLPDQVKFLEGALKRYAQAAIEEQLKAAAAEDKSCYSRYGVHLSPLNATRIELK